MPKLDTQRIEESLNTLPDVYAARVTMNATNDDVEEIHALASHSRSPKKVVRDIESLILVKFGLRIDYRRVSLVQVSEQDLITYFRRPKLVSVTQDTEDGFGVTVRLAHADNVPSEGIAQAQTNPPNPCRLAALATLRAVSDIVDTEKVTLADAQTAELSGQTVALVHLSRQTESGEERLLGCSFANPDVIHGAAQATLDALNRRLF